jgi:hypothetical protein
LAYLLTLIFSKIQREDEIVGKFTDALGILLRRRPEDIGKRGTESWCIWIAETLFLLAITARMASNFSHYKSISDIHEVVIPTPLVKEALLNSNIKYNLDIDLNNGRILCREDINNKILTVVKQLRKIR